MSLEMIHPQAVTEGAGARVQRLFPTAARRHIDPFVFCDHFRVQAGTGFPRHPHRGFEAITFMLKGRMQHEDNLGNRAAVSAGGAQRFTAGAGIEHSEMPEGDAEGIQLWINLPRAKKGISPAYQQADAVPVSETDGLRRSLIVGDQGPISLHTPVRLEMLELPGGQACREAVPENWQGFIYLIEGRLQLPQFELQPQQGVAITGSDSVTMEALSDSRFILALGQPHNEPIIHNGPFVD